jgi:hypothetical protein
VLSFATASLQDKFEEQYMGEAQLFAELIVSIQKNREWSVTLRRPEVAVGMDYAQPIFGMTANKDTCVIYKLQVTDEYLNNFMGKDKTKRTKEAMAPRAKLIKLQVDALQEFSMRDEKDMNIIERALDRIQQFIQRQQTKFHSHL